MSSQRPGETSQLLPEAGRSSLKKKKYKYCLHTVGYHGNKPSYHISLVAFPDNLTLLIFDIYSPLQLLSK